MGAASAVSAGAGALSAVTGVVSMISANKQKKAIAKEIANQKYDEVTNIGDGMRVSTLGADLQKEQQAKLAATQTSALQDGGTRAMLAGMGRVSAGSQNVNAQIGANLDEQKARIEDVTAQDNARIQGVKENRTNARLAALSSQYNAASQNASQGMANAVQGVGMAGNALANSSSGTSTDKTNTIKAKINPTTGRNIYAV
jgi:hypothetical protein